MASVTLEHVKKVYDNHVVAVQDFNLEIKDKEFVVFVGPSGCGKSTTLRMIAGLEDISEGTLKIGDRVVNDVEPKDRDIAMVFQNYALYPHITVYENMAFSLRIRKMKNDEVHRRVCEAAQILGITEYLGRKPKQLSGGQRQRVAIGRAIVREPQVFLMDEPLSNLDAKLRNQMRAEIILLRKRIHTTFIYVTHAQTEAMTMADRIVVMKDGYVQQIGTPRDVYFHPVNMFVAGFIGEPPMNFIRCAVKGGCVSLGDHTLDLSGKLGDQLNEYEGKEIIFGFRPEAVVLGENSAKYALSGTVELTEMLGDNANVYLDISGDKVIVKVSPHEIPPLESELVFSIPEESIYLFDAKTEMVI